MTADFISLGCSKNLVDSEKLMAMFEAAGISVTHDSDNPQGEIAVVNTCGFIADAKEESINTILEMVQRKSEGKLKRLYVMGCLSERYLAELEQEIPEVDGWYGKFNYAELLSDIKQQLPQAGNASKKLCSTTCQRHLTTPHHYAYLKISEGCDRSCAYCAIPLITGPHRSRPIEEIVSEVEWLVSKGVKELQVIAQELTYYGLDIYGEQRIAQLVEQIAKVPGVEWIRLHYAYPTNFPWELATVIRETPNVCKYLDIALQHCSSKILKRMRRNIDKEQTLHFIERLRKEVPGIHIRTTLMVGFPGENDADFEELLDFTRKARFERMGAFAYSEEDGTYAALHYTDDVPEDIKQHRLSRLMRVQQDISAEIEAAKTGQEMKVIIDRQEGEFLVGRSEYCSPGVDPEVLIPIEHVAGSGKKSVTSGQFCKVKITGAEEFDVYAQIINTIT